MFLRREVPGLGRLAAVAALAAASMALAASAQTSDPAIPTPPPVSTPAEQPPATPPPLQESPPPPPPEAPAPTAAPETTPPTPAPPLPIGPLVDAPQIERQTINALLASTSWPLRAIVAQRLERFDCAETQAMLEKLMADPQWQVRAFAVRSLGRRRVPAGPEWFVIEPEARVLRTAGRHRYQLDVERIGLGVQTLAKSADPKNLMLAVELALLTNDEKLVAQAHELLPKVILRMSRVDAGALSPRLAAVTGQPDMRRRFDWQHWLSKQGRSLKLYAALAIDEGPGRPTPGLFASLEPDRFADLESYMTSLRDRQVDLAICLDCTASMSGELAAAQGGIDDMMLFLGDVLGSLRIGLVAYRDRRDNFKTLAFDFTPDIGEARQRLWRLSAEGGADTPEAVEDALQIAYRQLTWRTEHSRVLVLVGDAPPHVGYGSVCVSMAEQAFRLGTVTHAIQASTREIKHFPQIAQAGGGQCVSLKDDDALVGEITGLTIGDRFADEIREFYASYLELCR